MGTYHQADNEVFIRSPNGSVLCQTTGSRYRPVSVAGVITDAGVVLPVEDNPRRHLIGEPASSTRPMRISPQLLADLEGSRSQLLERQPRSANPYEGPRSRRSSMLEELPSVGVGIQSRYRGIRSGFRLSRLRVRCRDRANFTE